MLMLPSVRLQCVEVFLFKCVSCSHLSLCSSLCIPSIAPRKASCYSPHGHHASIIHEQTHFLIKNAVSLSVLQRMILFHLYFFIYLLFFSYSVSLDYSLLL